MDPENTAPVSSITITLNEAEHIGDCLDSVAWCDEHIVIDEYSEDRTVEIAESHGADVYQMRTPDEANTFDILRQEAIEKASHDWILRIDADERSHSALNRRLQRLVRSAGTDVVSVPRMTFVGDDWVKTGHRWWPDRSYVLFERDSVAIQDAIHNYMRPAPDADVVCLPAAPESALYHYSYTSLWDLLKRRWRYAAIEAEIREAPLYEFLFIALSDVLEGVVVDNGFQKGANGVAVPVIDALYNVFIFLHTLGASESAASDGSDSDV